MTLSSTIRDLHRRKGRERRGLALAEGIRLVEEMLASGVACKGAMVSPALRSTPRGARLEDGLAASGAVLEHGSDEDLAALAATDHPQGIVAVYQPRRWTLDQLRPSPRHPLVVLDAVQDPGNVGTIARTAWALGASGVLALPGTADLTNPKAVRAAMGALFHLPHAHGADADLERVAAADSDAELWVTALDGVPLPERGPAVPLVLVFGNEGAGVRPELSRRAARTVTVPIAAGTESLNVAVTTGIVLHQVTR